MTTTGTLLTMEQFSELPDYDERTGNRYELDHGELIVVPPPKPIHDVLKSRIGKRLILFVNNHGLNGEVYVETGFVLDEDSWRVPDVSYLTEERVRAIDMDVPLGSAPDLAIEVASPSESRPAVQRKIDHFPASGAKVVWALYPAQRELHVHRTGQKVVKLGAEDSLQEPTLLPGFRVTVADLFAV